VCYILYALNILRDSSNHSVQVIL